MDNCEQMAQTLQQLVNLLQAQQKSASIHASFPYIQPPPDPSVMTEDVRMTYVQGLARFNAQLNESAADKIQAAAERNADRWQLTYARLAGIPAILKPAP